MTFTEAALEVLRSAGEPLHYKRITELAIAGNLLSHVGKTPEVTMSSRLATLVKKDRGQSPIIKVKPGVFALRESSMQADKDPSPNGSNESSTQAPRLEAEPAERAPERVERASLPGADVFPEEADDDAPILAGIDEGLEDRGRRRRRRRRRGGKGGPEGGPEVNGERREVRADPPTVRLDRDPARLDRDAGMRDRDANRRDRDSNRRDRDGSRRDGGGGGRRDSLRQERFEREQSFREEAQPELDLSRAPGEGDLLGKDLADAAYHVLARGERTPMNFVRVAELLVRRGRLNGTPAALAPTVAAALRADAARATRAHTRPRFRILGQRVSLSEWALPRDAVRSQETVEQNAEQQRDQVRRAFVSRLNELPAAGFAELVATWLNAEGVTALRAVKRPGSSSREFHFAGTLRRGVEENRLALVVLRAGRDIDRETVVDIRGSLHHYGGASGAWLITTGRINATAREEVSAEGAAPVALFGGADLARAMELLGIGLRLHYIPLCDIDFDLLESLGDGAVQGARREERTGRDRDRDSGRAERDGRSQRVTLTAQNAKEVGEREERPSVLPVAPDSEEEEGTGLDLLDVEAAEASRLVGATWDPGADDLDEEDDRESAPPSDDTSDESAELASADDVEAGADVDDDLEEDEGADEDMLREDLEAVEDEELDELGRDTDDSNERR